MSSHFPAIIIIAPLIAGFLISLSSLANRRFCFPIAVAGLGIAFYSSIGLIVSVFEKGVIQYRLGGWAPPMGIEYRIDYLNAFVLIMVSGVAFVNIFAVKKTAERDLPEKLGPFYSLYVLFTAGLLGITATGDAFNLYVLLEIAALTGYALIGIGSGQNSGRAAHSALNYIFMGTIGASFYLLGIGYLYIATGTLNMADLARVLPSLFGSNVIMAAFAICMTGLFMKMALFPMHGWLPNAYAYSSPAAASLIAPLTTKVMIYVMIRICLFVFTPAFSFEFINIKGAMVIVASVAIVAGSLFALSQKSLTKMLTYIIVAEVGYMVGGFWLGNKEGMTGSILHIANDAVMTLCLFLAAGIFAYKIKPRGEILIKDLGSMFSRMPVTMGAFVVAGLSIIGVPPACGFFSKWYLILGGIKAGQYWFCAALIFSSLVNVILFFRIFESAFFGSTCSNHEHGSAHETGHHNDHEAVIDEAPASMLVPLLVSTAMLIVLGFGTKFIVTQIIEKAISGMI